MVIEALARATTDQIAKAAESVSEILSRVTAALRVRAEEPLPTLDLDQMYTAVRVADEQADVHVPKDVTVPAGYSGWASVPLPADRVCIQRYGMEWGDPVIKLKWGIDTKQRVACKLHTVAPEPATFEYARYWIKRNVLYLYFENTDTANAAEFHLSVFAVMPKMSDWDIWGPKFQAHARRLLES